MADFTFNVSLGREVEFYNRVDSNDPANSAFILLVLQATGLEADSVLKDYATVAAILASTNDEPTNTGYVRKTLTDAELAAYSVDNSQDRVQLPFPTQTWTSVAAGTSWSKLILAYDSDTTAGTDTNLIPVTAHDLRYNGLAVVPNGTNIVVAGSNGFVVCD